MARGRAVKKITDNSFRERARGNQALAGLLALVTLGGMILGGCAGLANTSNADAAPQGAVQISPSTLTFPNVSVGQQALQTATLINTGSQPISITHLNVSSPEFSVAGISTPLTLRPGQSASFQVAFRSSSSGTVSGTLSAMTARGGGSTRVKLHGGSGRVGSQLSLSATSLKFGNVLVNGNSTQAVTLKNSGQTDLQISQIGVTGSGFSISGVATPVTLPAGQAVVLQTRFAPATPGAVSGGITISSDAQAATPSVALSGTGVAATYTMSLSPTALSFGNINVGSSASQNLQLSNTGNSSVTVNQVAASGNGISVSGLATPVTIAPSQSVTLAVKFAPAAAGPVSGSVAVTNSEGVNAVAAVTGSGAQAGLSVTPASASFGSVVTGNTKSQAIQLKNNGSANLTISQASATGTGFSVSGITLPLTLAPGQSGAVNVQYAPQSVGASTGAVSIVSDAPNSPATAALSGTGVAATYTMSLAPTSLSFGNVNVGSSAAQNLQLANTGNSSVTLTQVASSGSGISVSGIATPVTIAPSQSVALSVKYSPTVSGATAGSVTVVNDKGVNAVAAINGTGVQPAISLTPSTAGFGSVATGSTNSQTIQVKNSGTASLTISQGTITGTGFSLSGLALPQTLAPGQGSSFNVQYAPQAAGAVNGSVSIVSNAPNSPATVALSGTGVAATPTISLKPGSLSFGSVTNGNTAAQSFTVTNTGNSNVSISGLSVTGTGYSIASGGGAVTLSPNQSNSVVVQFAPTAGGTVNGSVNILSNATGSASSVSLSGTGVAPVAPHSVDLNWLASTSVVAGYNVYRSSVHGGSYARLNSSPVGGVSYADSSVQGGQTYYYVATSVDANGSESVYSNEVTAVIP
jgi:P pilus assembly chaperone PapD